jgi:hypothetical protein
MKSLPTSSIHWHVQLHSYRVGVCARVGDSESAPQRSAISSFLPFQHFLAIWLWQIGNRITTTERVWSLSVVYNRIPLKVKGWPRIRARKPQTKPLTNRLPNCLQLKLQVPGCA